MKHAKRLECVATPDAAHQSLQSLVEGSIGTSLHRIGRAIAHQTGNVH